MGSHPAARPKQIPSRKEVLTHEIPPYELNPRGLAADCNAAQTKSSSRVAIHFAKIPVLRTYSFPVGVWDRFRMLCHPPMKDGERQWMFQG